jgi:hypothetical protein
MGGALKLGEREDSADCIGASFTLRLPAAQMTYHERAGR